MNCSKAFLFSPGASALATRGWLRRAGEGRARRLAISSPQLIAGGFYHGSMLYFRGGPQNALILRQHAPASFEVAVNSDLLSASL
jgi:hypothetical protein